MARRLTQSDGSSTLKVEHHSNVGSTSSDANIYWTRLHHYEYKYFANHDRVQHLTSEEMGIAGSSLAANFYDDTTCLQATWKICIHSLCGRATLTLFALRFTDYARGRKTSSSSRYES